MTIPAPVNSSTGLSFKVRWQRGQFVLDCEAQLPVQGVTALFGRSGCGKSSLLRVMAGLERVPGATVQFADQVWQSGDRFVPAEKRRIGLVFQEHSLLPHLSVEGNLLYGWQRTPAALRRLQLPEVVAMLGIADLLERQVDQLSGGQAQRVALGRALLCSPQLLLLDEPLAALDTQTRREIMPFLSTLSREAGVPIVMITHSPDEVLRLADRVVFMQDGRINEICSLQQAMARPDSPLFVEEGPSSVLMGSLSQADEQGVCEFVAAAGEVRLFVHSVVHGAHPAGMPDLANNGVRRLRILARDVSVALDDPSRISIRNHLPVVIEQLNNLPGGRVLLKTRLADGQVLLIEVTQWSAQQLALTPGQAVWALIKSVALLP